MNLKPGDSVMAEPGGAAKVIYTDGCQVPVQVGGVVVIGPQSPCELRPKQGYMGLENTTGFSTTHLVIGGLLIAGGIGAAVALSGG